MNTVIFVNATIVFSKKKFLVLILTSRKNSFLNFFILYF